MTIKKLAGAVVGCALALAACADDGTDQASSVDTVSAVSAPSTEDSEELGDDAVATADETSDETSDQSSGDESDPSATADETSDGSPTATSVATTDETADGSTADTSADSATTTTEAATEQGTPNEGAGLSTPQAIISLSPTATEMLYAIGAGAQVLAVDEFSNHPPEAADKMRGLSGFEPNVEAIAGLEPDLVVTDGTQPGLLEQLDALGIPHWEGPAATTFDEVYSQIEELGVAVGRNAEAADVVANMQMELAALTAELPDLDEPLTYYHELDDTYYSVTSATFIGAVYEELGLVNIADDAGVDTAFPQLSAEYIIDRDPDLIFLACTLYCATTAESVAERPGWENLSAVTNGGVIEMNDDIASRWGPRIVDYVRIVGRAVNNVAPRPVVG